MLSFFTIGRNLQVLAISAFLMVAVAVPAFAQSGLAGEAQSAATTAIAGAAVVAGIVVGFAILYKLIRKVTG